MDRERHAFDLLARLGDMAALTVGREHPLIRAFGYYLLLRERRILDLPRLKQLHQIVAQRQVERALLAAFRFRNVQNPALQVYVFPADRARALAPQAGEQHEQKIVAADRVADRADAFVPARALRLWDRGALGLNVVPVDGD